MPLGSPRTGACPDCCTSFNREKTLVDSTVRTLGLEEIGIFKEMESVYFLIFFFLSSPVLSDIRESVIRSGSPYSQFSVSSHVIIMMLISSGRCQDHIVIEMKQIKRKIFLSLLRRGMLSMKAIFNFMDRNTSL